ncbi:MAG TPA: GNAT family N-acetyltransferase, partial [Pyrinomonadaceae bacterium]|nr:GNAT family N-acetyltransferase [Pyrinomonadaceae bacterium]
MRQFLKIALESGLDDYQFIRADQHYITAILALRLQLSKESKYVNTSTAKRELENIKNATDPEGIYQLVLYKGKPVAICIAYYEKDADGFSRTHIGLIAVLKQHAGNGIATKMMQNVFDWAAEMGCYSVTLYVNEDNPAARSLYNKMAFKDS